MNDYCSIHGHDFVEYGNDASQQVCQNCGNRRANWHADLKDYILKSTNHPMPSFYKWQQDPVNWSGSYSEQIIETPTYTVTYDELSDYFQND